MTIEQRIINALGEYPTGLTSAQIGRLLLGQGKSVNAKLSKMHLYGQIVSHIEFRDDGVRTRLRYSLPAGGR